MRLTFELVSPVHPGALSVQNIYGTNNKLMIRLNSRYLSIVTVATLCGFGNIPIVAAQAVSVSTTPVTIEAEEYVSENGTQLDRLRRGESGVYLGYIDDTDNATYTINVVQSGMYTLEARVSSKTNGGTIGFRTEDGLVGMLDINGTGGWFDWEVVSTTLELEDGEHDLRLDFVGGDGYLFNIDWFELQLDDPTIIAMVDPEIDPVVDGLILL